jgi:hypothetical protein
MFSRDDVVAEIRQAFAATPSPGPFLVGSREGSEPDEIIRAFAAFTQWTEPDAATPDRHYDVLSFFSEGGFRFFLPAYLIADLEGRLETADPIFYLTHGFSDQTVRLPFGQKTFERTIGGTVLLNPRRYGAITFHDHARFRLSVFSREEARAIVAYLLYKREADPDGLDRDQITAALEAFWLDRAAHAPDQDALTAHLAREAEELEAIREARGRLTDPEGP